MSYKKCTVVKNTDNCESAVLQVVYPGIRSAFQAEVCTPNGLNQASIMDRRNKRFPQNATHRQPCR